MTSRLGATEKDTEEHRLGTGPIDGGTTKDTESVAGYSSLLSDPRHLGGEARVR